MKALRRTSRCGGRGALLLVPLLAVGIGLFMYFGSSGSGPSYVRTVIKSKKTATETLERVNLTSLHRALQQYAIVNDGLYPASTRELFRQMGGLREMFEGDPNEPGYVYVPGQNERSAASNVLVYERRPDGGDCLVLRLDGRIETLSPEDLQAEIEKTKLSIR